MIDNTLKLVGLSLCLGILSGNCSENCSAAELTEDRVRSIRETYSGVEEENLEDIDLYESKLIYMDNIEGFLDRLPEDIKNDIIVRVASDGREYLCYKPELVLGYTDRDLGKEYIERGDKEFAEELRRIIGEDLGNRIKELVRENKFTNTPYFKSEKDFDNEEFWIRCFFYLLYSNSYNALFLDQALGKDLDDYWTGLKKRSQIKKSRSR